MQPTLWPLGPPRKPMTAWCWAAMARAPQTRPLWSPPFGVNPTNNNGNVRASVFAPASTMVPRLSPQSAVDADVDAGVGLPSFSATATALGMQPSSQPCQGEQRWLHAACRRPPALQPWGMAKTM